MSFWKKVLLRLLRILAGVPIVSLLVGGLLFLVVGATLRGRSVGLSAAILGGVLYCSVGYWNRKGLGCPVRLKIYDDEDHFLLFSRQEAVLGDIMEFMTAD